MLIYKPGHKTNNKKYRGITVLSTVAKVYDIILEERIGSIIETELEEPQRVD